MWGDGARYEFFPRREKARALEWEAGRRAGQPHSMEPERVGEMGLGERRGHLGKLCQGHGSFWGGGGCPKNAPPSLPAPFCFHELTAATGQGSDPMELKSERDGRSMIEWM